MGAFVAETLYTFMLCFVVLNTACALKTNSDNQFFGLAIGFVIVAGGYAVGGISGGAFNPAVACAIDLLHSNIGARWCWAYVAFEFLGAVIAAMLFRLVRPGEFDTPISKVVSSLLSEFLGTFMLIVTVGFNVLGGSAAPAFSIAASLMCMIYALGNVSGAHFNPAVTLAILLSKRNLIDGKEAAFYMAAQVIGGICAAFTYVAIYKGDTFPLGPGAGFGWAAVSVAELFYTFVLCFVVLNVATSEKVLSEFFGLAIGSCVTAGGYAIGSISGGSLNPAVSVGISTSMMYNGGLFWKCLVYTAVECLGAALAAGVFHATRPS